MASMKLVLTLFGGILLYCWVFWYLYILVMGLYRAFLAKRLTKVALVLGFPAIVAGLVVDWVANWTIASLWWWEWPKTKPLFPLRLELPDLVTTRLTRYINEPGTAVRKFEAEWLCTNLLDYFDPNGVHCTKQSPAQSAGPST